MNILFVTDLCPIKQDENLPLTLLEFILDFQKLGHKVLLFRPNVIPNVLIRGRKILKEGVYDFCGIRCINKNFLTPFFKESDFTFLKDEKFNLILSHMPSGILAANKISKKFNVPYFVSVHSSDIKVLEDIKYAFLKPLMKQAYMEAKMVLPRSFWLDERIKKNISNNLKTSLIPSGISGNAVLENVIKKDDLKRILSVGSLIKRKNFEELIIASKALDMELVIAGEGKNKKNLQHLIKKTGAKVKLLGKKSKEEINKLMLEFDLFILPSLNETFGMVYLEALSKGCVVVCSENSGMAGFIKDGFNGFISKPDNKSLIDTVKRIKEYGDIDKIKENALQTARDMEKIKMAENYLKNILF